MKIYYNPDNEGFYHEGVQKKIPTEAIEITKKQYEDFISIQNTGKKVSYESGEFIYLDREPSSEELKSAEIAWVTSELDLAGEELAKVQDSDPKAVGTVAQWREYRKALRAWPEHKDFPNKDKRPVAPDA